jgi:hypothetical protein
LPRWARRHSCCNHFPKQSKRAGHASMRVAKQVPAHVGM